MKDTSGHKDNILTNITSSLALQLVLYIFVYLYIYTNILAIASQMVEPNRLIFFRKPMGTLEVCYKNIEILFSKFVLLGMARQEKLLLSKDLLKEVLIKTILKH